MITLLLGQTPGSRACPPICRIWRDADISNIHFRHIFHHNWIPFILYGSGAKLLNQFKFHWMTLLEINENMCSLVHRANFVESVSVHAERQCFNANALAAGTVPPYIPRPITGVYIHNICASYCVHIIGVRKHAEMRTENEPGIGIFWNMQRLSWTVHDFKFG